MKKISALIVVLVSFTSFTTLAAPAAPLKNCKNTSGTAIYEKHLKADTKKCGTPTQDTIDINWYLAEGNPHIEKFMKKGCDWSDLAGIGHRVEELADICQTAPRHSAELKDPIVTIIESDAEDSAKLKWIVSPKEKGGREFEDDDLRDAILTAFGNCGSEPVACVPVFEKEVKREQQEVIGNARIRVCHNAFSTLRKQWAAGVMVTDVEPVARGGLKIFCNAPVKSAPRVVPKDEAVTTAAIDLTDTPIGIVTHGDEVEVRVGPTRVRETPPGRSYNFGVLLGLNTNFSVNRGNTVFPYVGVELGGTLATSLLFDNGVDFTLTVTYDRARRYPVWGIAPTYWGAKLSIMGGLSHDFLLGFYGRFAVGNHSEFEGTVSTQFGAGLQAEYILVEGVIDLRIFGAGGLLSESNDGYRIRVQQVDYQVDPTDSFIPEVFIGLKVVPMAW